VLASVKRIIEAEATASNAPKAPAFTTISQFPVTINDETATARTIDGMSRHASVAPVELPEPLTGSEDFGLFGTAWGVPSVFWLIGGTDHGIWQAAQEKGEPLPVNHSPFFAPQIHPTLKTGVQAMLGAAYAWLD